MHYPFLHTPIDAYVEAGFALTERERDTVPPHQKPTWPLALVPQVRGMAPQPCRDPGDMLSISGHGLEGDVIASYGDSILVEIHTITDPTALADDDAPRLTPGAIIELDLSRPHNADFAGGPEPLATFANTSLELFARSHLAWIRTITHSWEQGIIDMSAVFDNNERLAAEFVDHITALDTTSPFWELQAYHLEDLGIPTMAIFEFLGGRKILPEL